MVRKIFVDSRFRDSGNFANFQTTLATPVLHPKCRAYLDNIHIPNLFYTIHDNAKHIYIVETWLTNPGTAQEQGHARKRKIALTVGHYDIQSLAVELARVLNLNSLFPAGNTYTVTHSASTGRLTITLTNGGNDPIVSIWSMEYLKRYKDTWIDHTSNQVGTVVDDDDCYHALGFTAGGITEVTYIAPTTGNAHVSILPFHTLYLTCDFGLGSNEDCIGARGGNILRSIPVNTGFGNMIHDQLQNPFDFISLEPGQLRSFSFALRDVFQREVPLHHGFSFSILLVEEE